MKVLFFIAVIAVVYYYGFYEKEPKVADQSNQQQWPKPRPGLTQLPAQKNEKKKWSSSNALQGYKDSKQKAKDMEQQVLKAAQRQRKAIDG